MVETLTHKRKYAITLLFTIFMAATFLVYKFQISLSKENGKSYFLTDAVTQEPSQIRFKNISKEINLRNLTKTNKSCIANTCGTNILNNTLRNVSLRGFSSNLRNTLTAEPEEETRTDEIQLEAPTTKALETVLKTFKNNDIPLPLCPGNPPSLKGRKDVTIQSESPPFYETTEKENPLVSHGGHFKPPNCIARWKVAIVIPFRNRDEHLRYFLHYMHPILQRQQLEYRIYVINQFGNGKFNRAKLMNIGYAESTKDLDFDCFVFHDVDLILENDFAIYSCPEMPRHLSVAVNKFNYKLPYDTIFGGVTEFTKKQFEAVNGYSNSFWGWGGEDDDMYNRVRISHMDICRYPKTISRYHMILHGKEIGNEPNPERMKLITKTAQTIRRDGLNSLKYKVVEKEENILYTNITVNILGPP